MNNRCRMISIAVLLCYFCQPLQAKVTLPAIISNNMVLQRNADDPLWGWASPGEKVTINADWPGAKTVQTTASDGGKWMIKVKVPEAGGPYTITINGENSIRLKHVMIGEVWLCSGQSNMEMPVQGWGKSTPIRNSAAEIKAADYPDIHIFTVQRDIAVTPRKDVKGAWNQTTPKTVASFSATAYFFGRQLYKKLQIPIGLIHSSWGGTPAEAWTSGKKLRQMDMFGGYLDTLKANEPRIDQMEKKYQQQMAAYHKKVKSVDKSYVASNFDDTGWESMPEPSMWETQGLPNYDGIMWLRKKITIPSSWKGKTLVLSLGRIDDQDMTWFNGRKVGSITQNASYTKQRSYKIPARLVKSGANEIAIRVNDTGGTGGMADDSTALKLYPSSMTPSKGISLAGEWKYHPGIKMPQPAFKKDPHGASVLYNGMIAPLIPYGIRGAIWYQGEANVGQANQYVQLFPGMITDWRSRWDEGDFPFYFVQIAPFNYGGQGRKSPPLRDAQRRTLSLPNTGMASTMDIGNFHNIHPANKQAVGRRLSLLALNNVYDKKETDSGPLYKNMKINDGQIILSFSHIDGGLIAKNGGLRNFEIAGSDGKFIEATAKIYHNTVIVSSREVKAPQNVRYDWSDTPVPTLYNRAGLPASSFTTQKSLKNYK